MALLVPLLLGTTILFLPIWTLYTVSRNYVAARKINLPILVTPVDTFNPLWVLLRPYLAPWLSLLPSPLSAWAHYSYLGWVWSDKHFTHTRLASPAFTIVTPVENQIFIACPHAADEILRRRNDFIKKPAVYAPFALFGRNVNGANGKEWERQRKITATPFNERNSALVWAESVRQASEMLSTWTGKGREVTSTTQDTNLLALHVLSGAGFGMSYPFDSELKTPSAGHTMAYRDALLLVMHNLFTTILIGSARMPGWLLPKKVASVGEAIREFRQYMVEMVQRERVEYSQGMTGNGNLMSSLVQASEEAARAGEKGEVARGGLTDEEIYGNLFMYNVAGHETTANILAYAVAFMACYPQWQEWVGEEIEEVLGKGNESGGDGQYQQTFPRLKRCLALMYETLRLYAPLNGIPRYTADSFQILDIGGKEYTIPPKTAVFVNNAALQMMPQYWGADSLVWRPDRWIQKESTGEVLMPRTDGSYIPWTSGPRVCPGKKFSQVEFVAVLSSLLKGHRVRPVLLPGETEDDARKRLVDVVEDSEMEIAIKMNHPERLRVRWEKK